MVRVRWLVKWCLRLGRRLTNSRAAPWVLGVASVSALMAVTAINALDSMLQSMHGAGDDAAGLQSGLFRGPNGIASVVQGWSNFHAADTLGRYLSAPVIGTVSLLIDSLLFVPGYLLAGSILLLKGRAWNRHTGVVQRQAARRAVRQTWASARKAASTPIPLQDAELYSKLFGRRLRRAFLALVGLAFVDLLENVLSTAVLWTYWPSRTGWVDLSWTLFSLGGLLWIVTFVKWLLAAWVVVELLLLAARYLSDQLRLAGTALRLLRSQLAILVVLAILLQLPAQMPDAVLRLDLRQYVFTTILAILLATVQWAIGRHLVGRAADRRSRELNPTKDAPRRAWWVAFWACVILMALIAVQVAWREANPGDLSWEVVSGPGYLLLLLLVLAFGSRVTRRWPQAPLPDDEPDEMLGAGRLPRLLGAGIPVAVGLVVVRYAVGAVAAHAKWDEQWLNELWLLGFGVLLVALGPGLYAVFRSIDDRLASRPVAPGAEGWWAGRRYRIARAGVVASLLVAVAMVWGWGTLPVAVGTIGVVLLFLVGVSGLTGALVAWAEWVSTRYKLPSVLRVMGLRRVPVFSLFLVWFVFAAALDSGQHWEVRRLPGSKPLKRTTLEQAWTAWLEAQPSVTSSGVARPAVPLVIVAGAGGGIRAATWTALAVRCIFEGHPASFDDEPTECASSGPRPADAGSLFLASGISGSSMGLTQFVAHLTSNEPAGTDWITTHLKGDYVSPQLAWQLLVEVPRSLLHFRVRDRAEILEESWERSWDAVKASTGGNNPMAQGLLATQLAADRAGRAPLLLLNGDSVHDGCWLLASALDEGLRAWPEPNNELTRRLERPSDCHNLDPYTANRRTRTIRDKNVQFQVQFKPGGSLPGVLDAADFLCSNEDFRLSTAGLLSARYPEVSPAGRMSPCQAPTEGSPPRTKFVLDGGVIEASASESALAAWERVRPLVDRLNAGDQGLCVVPFFVQLDNGYLVSTNEAERQPPNQLTAPIGAAIAASSSRSERIRQAAAVAFSGSTIGPVNVSAPRGPLEERYQRLVPLGHPGPQASLGWALSDRTQKDLEAQLYRENRGAIKEIRRWLTTELTCSPAEQSTAQTSPSRRLRRSVSLSRS